MSLTSAGRSRSIPRIRWGIDNPLGVGGSRLHEWAFATRTGPRVHGRGRPGKGMLLPDPGVDLGVDLGVAGDRDYVADPAFAQVCPERRVRSFRTRAYPSGYKSRGTDPCSATVVLAISYGQRSGPG